MSKIYLHLITEENERQNHNFIKLSAKTNLKAYFDEIPNLRAANLIDKKVFDKLQLEQPSKRGNEE